VKKLIMFLVVLILGSTVVFADDCVCPQKARFVAGTELTDPFCAATCSSECKKGATAGCSCDYDWENIIFELETTCWCTCPGQNICEAQFAENGARCVDAAACDEVDLCHYASADSGCEPETDQLCCIPCVPPPVPEFTTIGVGLGIIIVGGAAYWLLKKKK
jgi:hypothetical protein